MSLYLLSFRLPILQQADSGRSAFSNSLQASNSCPPLHFLMSCFHITSTRENKKESEEYYYKQTCFMVLRYHILCVAHHQKHLSSLMMKQKRLFIQQKQAHTKIQLKKPFLTFTFRKGFFNYSLNRHSCPLYALF